MKRFATLVVLCIVALTSLTILSQGADSGKVAQRNMRKLLQTDEDGVRQDTAFLLALFVGWFGAGRFYMGLYLTASIKLVLTLITCVVNVYVRCFWTKHDEERAAAKAAIVCTFICATVIWWFVDWVLIIAGEITPANGEDFIVKFATAQTTQ